VLLLPLLLPKTVFIPKMGLVMKRDGEANNKQQQQQEQQRQRESNNTVPFRE
jgi:hypothetical protein